MIGKKTLETEPIPAAKVKEILEEFSEKHELSYEQNLTLAHVTNLNKLSLEDTEKLIEELEAYVDHKQAVRMADIVPRDMADLRLIFAKERNAPSNDEMKEILEILEKYDIEEDLFLYISLNQIIFLFLFFNAEITFLTIFTTFNYFLFFSINNFSIFLNIFLNFFKIYFFSFLKFSLNFN